MVICQGRSIYDFGFHFPRTPILNFPKKTNNPNPSPIGNKFGLFLFGPSGENRTHGLLNPIVLLSKTQWTLRYHLYAVSSNFKIILSFCFVRCQDVSFLLVELSSSQTNKSFYTEKQGAPCGRTLPKATDNSYMYNREFPRAEFP